MEKEEERGETSVWENKELEKHSPREKAYNVNLGWQSIKNLDWIYMLNNLFN